ncbi:aspartyl protease family protein [Hyphomonadaceae bacterium BL14]|nr:aspartyl protease family protein [Hyphomonadaceae bacterium BL14]
MTTMLATLLSTLSLYAAAAQAGGAPDTRLPLARASSGQFLIDVSIAGGGPWPFMIDTGASHTTLARPVAEALGFISTREHLHPVQTLTAETLEERLEIAAMRFGPARADGINAVVADVIGGEIQGLIGLDALAGERVRLDFPAGEIVFDVAALDSAHGRIHPVHGVAVMEARVHGIREPVMVLVDTGSGFTMINSALARRLVREPVTRMRVSGITRSAPSADVDERARLERLRIGGVCVRSMRAVQADVDIFRALGWRDRPAMVLGLDLLQHTIVTVEGDARTIRIDPGTAALSCPEDYSPRRRPRRLLEDTPQTGYHPGLPRPGR